MAANSKEVEFTADEVTTILEAIDMAIKAAQRQINTREGAVKAAFLAQKIALEELKPRVAKTLAPL